jgi:hypothetical protein
MSSGVAVVGMSGRFPGAVMSTASGRTFVRGSNPLPSSPLPSLPPAASPGRYWTIRDLSTRRVR